MLAKTVLVRIGRSATLVMLGTLEVETSLSLLHENPLQWLRGGRLLHALAEGDHLLVKPLAGRTCASGATLWYFEVIQPQWT